MQAQRAKLPMAGLRQQLADTLAGSDAVVVSGETGSGKTTQVGVIALPPCSPSCPPFLSVFELRRQHTPGAALFVVQNT
jgi:ABC-type taurine transport system ATPase subunit